MKCSKCQTENPQENRFCRKCGANLLLTCPQCGAEVLSDDRYCGKCGQELDEATETADTAPEPEGERKHVTVLFSDLSQRNLILRI
jgi:predicted amidophosphoribosyltransferase